MSPSSLPKRESPFNSCSPPVCPRYRAQPPWSSSEGLVPLTNTFLRVLSRGGVLRVCSGDKVSKWVCRAPMINAPQQQPSCQGRTSLNVEPLSPTFSQPTKPPLGATSGCLSEHITFRIRTILLRRISLESTPTFIPKVFPNINERNLVVLLEECPLWPLPQLVLGRLCPGDQTPLYAPLGMV